MNCRTVCSRKLIATSNSNPKSMLCSPLRNRPRNHLMSNIKGVGHRPAKPSAHDRTRPRRFSGIWARTPPCGSRAFAPTRSRYGSQAGYSPPADAGRRSSKPWAIGQTQRLGHETLAGKGHHTVIAEKGATETTPDHLADIDHADNAARAGVARDQADIRIPSRSARTRHRSHPDPRKGRPMAHGKRGSRHSPRSVRRHPIA